MRSSDKWASGVMRRKPWCTAISPRRCMPRLDSCRFSEGQRVAITRAVTYPACILTGGPGCGKTFATRAIVQYWANQGKSVAMCAPTGRAAQRLQEIVRMPGLVASTIHRCGGRPGPARPGEGYSSATCVAGKVVYCIGLLLPASLQRLKGPVCWFLSTQAARVQGPPRQERPG